MTNKKKAQCTKKAEDLVAQMTLEEAASQMIFTAAAIPRLGIPEYNWWNEALHGVARAGTATSFPQAIALAATFDAELLGEISATIAEEARAKYNSNSIRGDRGRYKGLTFWSPNINIFRDPRWGRGHETYGEDPYLTARLGVAFIKGLQGDGEVLKTAACAKHYAVHSGPEALRHEFNAECSRKDLFETYLPAFEACVREAEVEAVMGAYNRTLGEACCASQLLLVDILRGRWGFDGHIVSDCWALLDIHEHHKITSTVEESAALALKAGCDLNCGSVYSSLMDTYNQGLISEEDIRRSAVRVMAARFKLGILGERSEYDSIPFDVVDCAEHRALSIRAAAESCVLLKNDGLLPLDKTGIKSLAIIGPNADSRVALKGNYYGNAARYVTIADGLREYMGDDVSVRYSEGCKLSDTWIVEPPAELFAEAAATAEACDLTVLVLGLDETIEGEEAHDDTVQFDGDKPDIMLPKQQQKLLDTVIATGKPIVVVLMAGSSIDLRMAQKAPNVRAILNAWYPGALGGKAVAKLLFGECSPCGKLPVTFYNSVDDLPDFTDYSMENRTYRYFTGDVLYPFGFGLTYGDVRVTDASYNPESKILSVMAKNNGKMATKDVIQVYIKAGSIFAPVNPRLCAFAKAEFAPGVETTIKINMPDDAFTVINDIGERIYGGPAYELYIGTGQPDSRTKELSGNETLKIVCIDRPGQ
ncbi:MAG: glycoside hydrolase family 3 C-terminal domain-containing protein [Oscillospiraceae bacterium]|nr:glycoside hydrolase family 3 C-terminal domain-containing protein [Oscillospiraceae bacterium]